MDVLAPKIGEIIAAPNGKNASKSQTADSKPRAESRRFVVVSGFAPLWHPHAGFGLGFERLVQFMTGMGNIRM